MNSIPHKCPVCNGSGKVSRPPNIAGDVHSWSGSTNCGPWQCNACLGSGIIWGVVNIVKDTESEREKEYLFECQSMEV